MSAGGPVSSAIVMLASSASLPVTASRPETAFTIATFVTTGVGRRGRGRRHDHRQRAADRHDRVVDRDVAAAVRRAAAARPAAAGDAQPLRARDVEAAGQRIEHLDHGRVRRARVRHDEREVRDLALLRRRGVGALDQREVRDFGAGRGERDRGDRRRAGQARGEGVGAGVATQVQPPSVAMPLAFVCTVAPVMLPPPPVELEHDRHAAERIAVDVLDQHARQRAGERDARGAAERGAAARGERARGRRLDHQRAARAAGVVRRRDRDHDRVAARRRRCSGAAVVGHAERHARDRRLHRDRARRAVGDLHEVGQRQVHRCTRDDERRGIRRLAAQRVELVARGFGFDVVRAGVDRRRGRGIRRARGVGAGVAQPHLRRIARRGEVDRARRAVEDLREVGAVERDVDRLLHEEVRDAGRRVHRARALAVQLERDGEAARLAVNDQPVPGGSVIDAGRWKPGLICGNT